MSGRMPKPPTSRQLYGHDPMPTEAEIRAELEQQDEATRKLAIEAMELFAKREAEKVAEAEKFMRPPPTPESKMADWFTKAQQRKKDEDDAGA